MTGPQTPLQELPCPCRRNTLWMEVRFNTIINFDVKINIYSIVVFLWIGKGSCLASSWYFTPSFFSRIVFTWLIRDLSQEILYRHGGSDGHDNGLPVLVDHLHLRDGHLPLPLLRILLDRRAQEDAGWSRGGEQTGAYFPRFSIVFFLFFLKIKKCGALCFALENKLVRLFPDSHLGCF